MQEEKLIKLARRNDTASIKEIYSSNVQYLTAVCSRYIPDEDEMKDILQDSFIKIFSSLDRFVWRGRGSLRAWMSRIVVNESLMSIRNKAKKGEISFEGELPDKPSEEEPELEDIPMSVLQDMIKDLPAGYRTVFNLYVFEEMSHKEIASTLGISDKTSRSQFCRARAMLCNSINEYRKNEK